MTLSTIKNCLLRASYVVSAFVFIFFTPLNASAASTDDFIDKFAANNIMFYNPNECDEKGGGGSININKDNLLEEAIQQLEYAKVEEKARQNLAAYEAGAREYGIPWQALAAIHYREAGMDPTKSIADGESLGIGTSIDGVAVGDTLEEDAKLAAKHLVEMGKMVYDVDITKDSSLESLGQAFLSYNRGFMYKTPGVDWKLSPYVMNYIDEDHKGMVWQHADSWNGSQKLNSVEGLKDSNVGALVVYVYLGGTFDGSSSGGINTANSDGENVTIIGDSITYMSSNSFDDHGFKKYLTKADIHSLGSKHMFMNREPNYGGDSGETILNNLISQDKVKDILVMALGTNDTDSGEITKDKLKTRIVDRVKDAQKIVFVTNYNINNPTLYDSNNKAFQDLASEDSKVVIADWKKVVESNTSLITNGDGMGVHPTAEGADEFAKVIMQAIGADLYGQNDSSSCTCSENTGSVEGGLTDEQAEKLIEVYKSSKYDSQVSYYANTKANCVALSNFFGTIYTSMKNKTWPDGKEVANQIKQSDGLETGKEPRPFSIFSVTSGSTVCSDGFLCGHTGVVVAVNGDEVTTVEAAWGNAAFTGVKKRTKDYFVNEKYGDTFVYLDSILDKNKLAEDVGGSIDSGSSDKIVVNATWDNGWLTSGIQGYVKQSAVEAENSGSFRIADAVYLQDFETKGSDGTPKANKFTLHSTEGVNEQSGLKVYGDNGFPAHFTVDMKNKKAYQHLPINKPATSIKAHDKSAGIQIEIMGFSTPSSTGYKADWDVTSSDAFGDAEWAYLATLMTAIAKECDIDATKSSVNWESPSRIASASEFKDYTGVLGHMHVTDNDHTDPGNIWPMLSKALGAMTNGKDCGGTYTGGLPYYGQCDDKWANKPFGSSNVCSSGCGPSSFAMMATVLLQKEIFPDEVAKIAGDKGMYVPGAGSSWDITRVLAEHYGLDYQDVSLGGKSSQEQIETINKLLKEGWMIHTSGKGSYPFSSGGHYIGIAGLTSDGKWQLADSGHSKEQQEKPSEPIDVINAGMAMDNVRAIKRK